MTHPGCPSSPRCGLPHRHLRTRGFTLVELLIAVAIGALLVGIAVPGYTAFMERSRVQRAVADLHDLQMRLTAWRARTGAFPRELADVGGPQTDPWGRPYRYLDFATLDASKKSDQDKVRRDRNLKPINTDFDLYSVGRDRTTDPSLNKAESKDDVIRAANGRFFGLAEKF